MKLAAIDIGTNSIHMIIVDVIAQRNFEVIEREKEMVKLGVGVFATNRLSDRAFNLGVETISRYVRLAEQRGVDAVITAATSAIREAQNGEAFINKVIQQTGISPKIISGKEEARLIFLAVRNSIALEDRTALVIDIGGGSTETVVGNRQDVLFGDSLQLGVLRLLDMFEDKGPVGEEGRSVLEAHIQFVAQKTLDQIQSLGFDQVIGTSGTIRTLGEAAHLKATGESLRSVNAEVVSLTHIADLTQGLLGKKLEKRAKVEGISDKRADAIHLGGILLVKLLEIANAKEITLCEASLREGMILDYLERHSHEVETFLPQANLRYRKAAQLVQKYQADWQQNCHVANLALQLFDQTQDLHQYDTFERELLEFAALLHDVGQYISFQKHHKNSRYIISRADLRGFTDEEILLMGHLARYHCKAAPTKNHKRFRRLSKSHRRIVQTLSGMLRIAVSLDKTKNQRVTGINCKISDTSVKIRVKSTGKVDLELWAAGCDRNVLATALKRDIDIQA
ncbi:Ppx/GppA family phosphatase [Leptolyngbya cf. ectocarpi LEGE 11479]|uniref:Ppx/GppA family phosphatase n=1 Tax=Leptolyngbya cf. ectocarpi LEGE 11479 TaxID=1828722 RepID=A0A928WZJ6_LEPEC|nr:Ppx/GppA phosphatase family protein [Leptolyngbya ectocarpi]MBE9065732.1 Ppx/GppA family phosphatase [Leptolyngbya cf. ectocarpi LEGE 11479]